MSMENPSSGPGEEPEEPDEEGEGDPAPPGGMLSWRPRPRAVMTVEQILAGRVEHRPPGPTCAACRHLGEPVRVAGRDGARRVRRHCPCHPLGHTAPDWPVCPAFESR
jgi:hypothetical protein